MQIKTIGTLCLALSTFTSNAFASENYIETALKPFRADLNAALMAERGTDKQIALILLQNQVIDSENKFTQAFNQSETDKNVDMNKAARDLISMDQLLNFPMNFRRKFFSIGSPDVYNEATHGQSGIGLIALNIHFDDYYSFNLFNEKTERSGDRKEAESFLATTATREAKALFGTCVHAACIESLSGFYQSWIKITASTLINGPEIQPEETYEASIKAAAAQRLLQVGTTQAE